MNSITEPTLRRSPPSRVADWTADLKVDVEDRADDTATLSRGAAMNAPQAISAAERPRRAPASEPPRRVLILGAQSAIAEEAGLPAGVFNVVPAGRETGDYLVRHPGVDKISFTGSTAAGRHIMAACAGRMARCSFELGGKSAAVVLDDAKIDQVLQSLVPYSMPITGQVCFSLTRVLVPRARATEVRDAYVAAVSKIKVGDPFDAGTQMGPLTMKRQLTRVEGYIEKGRSEGARLVLGGGRPSPPERNSGRASCLWRRRCCPR